MNSKLVKLNQCHVLMNIAVGSRVVYPIGLVQCYSADKTQQYSDLEIMTTVTSHTLPLISLQLNMSPMGALDAMTHPEGRTIHDHMLTESSGGGRLQADALRLSTPKQEQVSPNSRHSSEHSFKNQSNCDMDRLDVRKLIAHDEISDARSSSVSSYMADYFQSHKDPDDEQMSFCSDDSELSVGKEVESGLAYEKDNVNRKNAEEIESEITDEVYSARLHEKASETNANIDPLRYSNKLPNLIRPNPTRMQEEFLRKSQLYAEELMKHQMNFMAATRGLNINPKIADHALEYAMRNEDVSPMRPSEEHRSGFRPHIRISSDIEQKWSHIEDRSSQSPETTCFRGIHSHLNAISKITSALGRDMTCLTSPCSMTSRESSQSPPNNLHQIINNNLNEASLKFSIDNILKPGFGSSRRITDPLLKRNIKNVRKTNHKNASVEVIKQGAPIDLTATPSTPACFSPTSPASSVPEQDKSATANNNATENAGKGGPMVWPAWVYCTRYSDRPSSGTFLLLGHVFINPCLE